jgi:hypothetical protein
VKAGPWCEGEGHTASLERRIGLALGYHLRGDGRNGSPTLGHDGGGRINRRRALVATAVGDLAAVKVPPTWKSPPSATTHADVGRGARRSAAYPTISPLAKRTGKVFGESERSNMWVRTINESNI